MDDIPLSLPLMLDGATGTELMKRGMPADACMEQWVLERLMSIFRSKVSIVCLLATKNIMTTIKVIAPWLKPILSYPSKKLRIRPWQKLNLE